MLNILSESLFRASGIEMETDVRIRAEREQARHRKPRKIHGTRETELIYSSKSDAGLNKTVSPHTLIPTEVAT